MLRSIRSTVSLPELQPTPLNRHLRYVLEQVCEYDGYSGCFPTIPERPEVMQAFPVLKATKKGAVGRDKSTKGYVWLDTDPVAILCNKYVIGSCHTLDNTQHEYRSGNLNWVYNPYMATLFAGRHCPTEQRNAVSPETDRELYLGGDIVSIREHQVTCNVLLVFDSLCGKPYLFLSSIYDSCYETPWQHTLLRYMHSVCRRLGIGLATDKVCWSSIACSDKNGRKTKGIREVYPIVDSGVDFSTPSFQLPGRTPFPNYTDGTLGWRSDYSGNVAVSCEGYIVLEPTKSAEELGLDGLSGAFFAGWAGTLDLASEGMGSCCECGERYSDDDLVTSNTGSSYCHSCYSDEFTSCERCGEEIEISDCRSNDNGESICERCFDRYYEQCESCDKVVESSDSYTGADDKEYCSDCWDEHFTDCEECGSTEQKEDCKVIDDRILCCSCAEEECEETDILLDAPAPEQKRTVYQAAQTEMVGWDTGELSLPAQSAATSSNPPYSWERVIVKVMPKNPYVPGVLVFGVAPDGTETLLDSYHTIGLAVSVARDYCDENSIQLHCYRNYSDGPGCYAIIDRCDWWMHDTGDIVAIYHGMRRIGHYSTKQDAVQSWRDRNDTWGHTLWDSEQFLDETWKVCGVANTFAGHHVNG
jgi:hypothetical protein